MKLNNKGFAITGILYGLLILFALLVGSYLTILTAKKNRLDGLIEANEEEYRLKENTKEELSKTCNLIYNANNGSWPSNAPDNIKNGEEQKVDANAITITTTIPSRTGYSFTGWDTSKTSTSAVYLPNKTYKITCDNTITLYAVWVKGDLSIY